MRVCICVYACMHMHKYVCIHMRACVQILIFKNITRAPIFHKRTHAYTHHFAHVLLLRIFYTHLNKHSHTNTHTHLHTHTCTHTQARTHTHTCMLAHTHARHTKPSAVLAWFCGALYTSCVECRYLFSVISISKETYIYI